MVNYHWPKYIKYKKLKIADSCQNYQIALKFCAFLFKDIAKISSFKQVIIFFS